MKISFSIEVAKSVPPVLDKRRTSKGGMDYKRTPAKRPASKSATKATK